MKIPLQKSAFFYLYKGFPPKKNYQILYRLTLALIFGKRFCLHHRLNSKCLTFGYRAVKAEPLQADPCG